MALSGSVDFNVTGSDIVRKALALIADRDAEIPLENNEISDGLQSLNILVKNWNNQGLHLWKRDEAILFLDVGVSQYLLGPGGAEATLVDDFINTEIATAAVALDTTLVVDSTTGMSGAADIFAVNQATLIGSWTPTNATLAVVSDKLVITNSAALAGFAELALTDLTVGRAYRFTYGYEVGTSTSATFSIISNSIVLATATQTVTGTFILDFTATETTADFRAANVSTTITETTLVTAANFVDTTTGDFVGIELDDNTRQWTKILSIAGTTLTLVDAITSAAAINNSVFTFTSLIERPLRITGCRRSRLGDNTEVEIDKWSEQEYRAQTNKASEGVPTAFYYSPSLSNGEIFIWQTADSVQRVLKFTFQRPIQITPTFRQNGYSL